AGERVVLVRRCAAAGDRVALLVERGGLGEVDAGAVQIVHVLGDDLPLGVLPGAAPDAVLGIDRCLAALRLRAQISAPGLVAGARRLRELLAFRIRAGKPAEIAALADPGAGHEKGHGRLLRLRAGAKTQRQQSGRREDGQTYCPVHCDPPSNVQFGMAGTPCSPRARTLPPSPPIWLEARFNTHFTANSLAL